MAGDVLKYCSWNTSYAVTGVTTGLGGSFSIADADGSLATLLSSATLIRIEGSTGNDGLYTIVSAIWAIDTTVVVVTEAVPDGTVDGKLMADPSLPADGDDRVLNHAMTLAGALGTQRTVASIDHVNKSFTISGGDYTADFASADCVRYLGGDKRSGNQGVYTFVSCRYDYESSGNTDVFVSETIPVDVAGSDTIYAATRVSLTAASLDCKGSGSGSLTLTGVCAIDADITAAEGLLVSTPPAYLDHTGGDMVTTLDVPFDGYWCSSEIHTTGMVVGGGTANNSNAGVTVSGKLVAAGGVFGDGGSQGGVLLANCYIIGDVEGASGSASGVVLGHGGQTLLNGPLFDSYASVSQGEQFVANEIQFAISVPAAKSVPAASVWSLALLGILLVGSVAFLLRKSQSHPAA
jgi:hypothetical protein